MKLRRLGRLVRHDLFGFLVILRMFCFARSHVEGNNRGDYDWAGKSKSNADLNP